MYFHAIEQHFTICMLPKVRSGANVFIVICYNHIFMKLGAFIAPLASLMAVLDKVTQPVTMNEAGYLA
jgi:hypothetical protein